MKKMFIDPDFELIRIGLVADITTNSQSVEGTVPITGETLPPEEDDGDFGKWD